MAKQLPTTLVTHETRKVCQKIYNTRLTDVLNKYVWLVLVIRSSTFKPQWKLSTTMEKPKRIPGDDKLDNTDVQSWEKEIDAYVIQKKNVM